MLTPRPDSGLNALEEKENKSDIPESVVINSFPKRYSITVAEFEKLEDYLLDKSKAASLTKINQQFKLVPPHALSELNAEDLLYAFVQIQNNPQLLESCPKDFKELLEKLSVEVVPSDEKIKGGIFLIESDSSTVEMVEHNGVRIFPVKEPDDLAVGGAREDFELLINLSVAYAQKREEFWKGKIQSFLTTNIPEKTAKIKQGETVVKDLGHKVSQAGTARQEKRKLKKDLQKKIKKRKKLEKRMKKSSQEDQDKLKEELEGLSQVIVDMSDKVNHKRLLSKSKNILEEKLEINKNRNTIVKGDLAKEQNALTQFIQNLLGSYSTQEEKEISGISTKTINPALQAYFASPGAPENATIKEDRRQFIESVLTENCAAVQETYNSVCRILYGDDRAKFLPKILAEFEGIDKDFLPPERHMEKIKRKEKQACHFLQQKGKHLIELLLKGIFLFVNEGNQDPAALTKIVTETKAVLAELDAYIRVNEIDERFFAPELYRNCSKALTNLVSRISLYDELKKLQFRIDVLKEKIGVVDSAEKHGRLERLAEIEKKIDRGLKQNEAVPDSALQEWSQTVQEMDDFLAQAQSVKGESSASQLKLANPIREELGGEGNVMEAENLLNELKEEAQTFKRPASPAEDKLEVARLASTWDFKMIRIDKEEPGYIVSLSLPIKHDNDVVRDDETQKRKIMRDLFGDKIINQEEVEFKDDASNESLPTEIHYKIKLEDESALDEFSAIFPQLRDCVAFNRVLPGRKKIKTEESDEESVAGVNQDNIPLEVTNPYVEDSRRAVGFFRQPSSVASFVAVTISAEDFPEIKEEKNQEGIATELEFAQVSASARSWQVFEGTDFAKARERLKSEYQTPSSPLVDPSKGKAFPTYAKDKEIYLKTYELPEPLKNSDRFQLDPNFTTCKVAEQYLKDKAAVHLEVVLPPHVDIERKKDDYDTFLLAYAPQIVEETFVGLKATAGRQKVMTLNNPSSNRGRFTQGDLAMMQCCYFNDIVCRSANGIAIDLKKVLLERGKEIDKESDYALTCKRSVFSVESSRQVFLPR